MLGHKNASTQALAERMPSPKTLKRWCQSLAALDAIVSPEWEYRYFSFNHEWAPDTQVASMRDGSGNDFSITFTPTGTLIRAFDHESPALGFRRRPSGSAAVAPCASTRAVA